MRCWTPASILVISTAIGDTRADDLTAICRESVNNWSQATFERVIVSAICLGKVFPQRAGNYMIRIVPLLGLSDSTEGVKATACGLFWVRKEHMCKSVMYFRGAVCAAGWQACYKILIESLKCADGVHLCHNVCGTCVNIQVEWIDLSSVVRKSTAFFDFSLHRAPRQLPSNQLLGYHADTHTNISMGRCHFWAWPLPRPAKPSDRQLAHDWTDALLMQGRHPAKEESHKCVMISALQIRRKNSSIRRGASATVTASPQHPLRVPAANPHLTFSMINQRNIPTSINCHSA